MSAAIITSLHIEKCGDEPPTGDYDNGWGWRAPDLPPFRYCGKKDQAYLVTWEGGHYSIDYVNIPRAIAGVPLTFTRIESFWRPCDYRGKGSVHMYKTQRGLMVAIRARLRRGLRHLARRWLAARLAKKVLGADIGSMICRYM